jgi:hypothetical protein
MMPELKQIDLYVRNKGNGTLCIFLQSETDPIGVNLQARLVTIIIRLQTTLDAHKAKDYPLCIQGWMTAPELAYHYDPFGPEVKPQDETMVQYVSLIGKEIKQMIELELIDHGKDHEGYRLAQPVNIIYLDNASQSLASAHQLASAISSAPDTPAIPTSVVRSARRSARPQSAHS